MQCPFLIPILLAATLVSSATENEKSLTERLKTFYDCYVTGHFRQADSLVAPDSKDAFFEAAKERFRSYEISRINLKDGGATAEVMLVVDAQFQFSGKSIPIKMPVLAYWKKVDGLWYWHAPVRDVPPLPFGPAKSKGAVTAADRTLATTFRPFPSAPSQSGLGQSVSGPPNPGQAVVTALLDKPVLILSPGKQNEDIAHLRNTSKFPLEFHIEFNGIPGINLSPLEGAVNPGESIAIGASAVNPSAFVHANTKYAGYIVIRSGIRLQFYVSVESSPTAAAAKAGPNRAALSCLAKGSRPAGQWPSENAFMLPERPT